MVAGHSRSGKTDFLATLVETLHIHQLHPREAESEDPKARLFNEKFAGPKPLNSVIECSDPFQSSRIRLVLIDTPGLAIPSDIHRMHDERSRNEHARTAQDYLSMMLPYIEEQFDNTLQQESKVRRNPNIEDTQVHACLYLLNPDIILASKGLTSIDKAVLARLGAYVNIIPCLAKSVFISTKNRIW